MTGAEPMHCTCPSAWFGVVPPSHCAMHNPSTFGYVTANGTTATNPFAAKPMLDSDIDRIARRVVELLNAPKDPP